MDLCEARGAYATLPTPFNASGATPLEEKAHAVSVPNAITTAPPGPVRMNASS